MKIKLAICLLLSFIRFTAFAQESHPIALKTVGYVTPSQERLIVNAFRYLNQFWSGQRNSFSRKVMEQYFDPDTYY